MFPWRKGVSTTQYSNGTGSSNIDPPGSDLVAEAVSNYVSMQQETGHEIFSYISIDLFEISKIFPLVFI